MSSFETLPSADEEETDTQARVRQLLLEIEERLLELRGLLPPQ